MERIETFFAGLEADGMTNNEIAAGLGNGDLDIPEWMSISEDTDHIKAWDNETQADQQSGFVTINYEE